MKNIFLRISVLFLFVQLIKAAAEVILVKTEELVSSRLLGLQ
jgi:hypothetical protein